MTIRTFIACDACNREGARYVEQRRNPGREQRGGRRISDGRSWFDGTLEDALAHGWARTSDQLHICPDCQQRGLGAKLTASS